MVACESVDPNAADISPANARVGAVRWLECGETVFERRGRLTYDFRVGHLRIERLRDARDKGGSAIAVCDPLETAFPIAQPWRTSRTAFAARAKRDFINGRFRKKALELAVRRARELLPAWVELDRKSASFELIDRQVAGRFRGSAHAFALIRSREVRAKACCSNAFAPYRGRSRQCARTVSPVRPRRARFLSDVAIAWTRASNSSAGTTSF